MPKRAAQQRRPAPEKTDEIEEIFQAKKKKGAAVTKSPPPAGLKKATKKTTQTTKAVAKKATEKSAVERRLDPRDQGPRGRKVVDGLPVYSEDELGLGVQGGGNTPLCPFDCQCCH